MTTTEQETLLQKFARDKLIAKYVLKHTWLSGGNTTVYPIQGWRKTIDIQVSTHKNIFSKCIQRLISISDGKIISGKFIKSDGSCPSYIELVMKDEII